MNLRKVGTVIQFSQKKTVPYTKCGKWEWWIQNKKHAEVHSYLEQDGMSINEFGNDPDKTFSNSSEKDEERLQVQSEFDHKIHEILELLIKLFLELMDDGKHEIESFCKVWNELLKTILWEC